MMPDMRNGAGGAGWCRILLEGVVVCSDSGWCGMVLGSLT